MTQDQLKQQGEELARQIAAGIIAGVAAGTADFAATMREVQTDAEQRVRRESTSKILQLADVIDAERAELKAQLADAKGLRAAGIRHRLAELEALEKEAERRLDLGEMSAETPALPQAGPDEVAVSAHTRRKSKKA